jgi:hypothetical protein
MSEPVTPFERLLADELRAHVDAARLERPAKEVVTQVTSRPTTRPVVRGPVFGRLATVLAAALAVLLVVVVLPRLALVPSASSPSPSAPPSAPPLRGGDMGPTPWPDPPSATPTPSPDPPPTTPTSTPEGAIAELTNPDGPDPADYPPDAYPLIETANELPTFGQLWFDDNQRDVHIALTGDVEGAIEALRDEVPRGVTVYFHIVQHSQAELCAIRDQMFADRDELMRRGIVLSSGGCGSAKNRVEVGLSPLTPEVLAYMRSRYDGPIDYEDGGWSALTPYQPLEPGQVRLTAVREGEDLGLFTCGRRPFPADAIDGFPIDIESDGDEYRTLREALNMYLEVYGDLSRLGWILAEKDEYGATFLADRGETWLEAPVFAGRNGWVPGTIDYCAPRPLTGSDGGAAALYLDPAFPEPGPQATEIHVLVEEQACSSGSSPADRLLPPTARFTGDSVTLKVLVRGVGGPAACPGNPRLPVVIELPEPLGDRALRGIAPAPEY